MDKNDKLRKELKEVINKAILTVGVGEIADVEGFIGFLWGQGKDFNELTDEEKECRKEWELIREKFFDRMNDFIRKLDKKVDSLDIQERQYTYVFINKNNSNFKCITRIRDKK